MSMSHTPALSVSERLCRRLGSSLCKDSVKANCARSLWWGDHAVTGQGDGWVTGDSAVTGQEDDWVTGDSAVTGQGDDWVTGDSAVTGRGRRFGTR